MEVQLGLAGEERKHKEEEESYCLLTFRLTLFYSFLHIFGLKDI